MIRTETVRQRGFVTDIFGIPHRPTAVDIAWLTSAVISLAALVWEYRVAPAPAGSLILDTQRLGILADALKEAGCEDTGVLGHLRQSGKHVRGCRVLDLLLGKE